ncbi:DUF1543 domain-containing protein [Synechococcus sp. CS-1325]|uniref:DUF1543 domain-containing protein n=1 Tax=unclassified Synechococcus TaxID=2626047 RepID=UPI000DB21461|nr:MULTISPECIES: DUF1543 domain-containing protein [unclassified Synechococcus]MCT0199786.1 DUF1543 domain-containing protein [Synechococcus sp. CS-1325]MCT0214194.1 DUF1543 domain-containing protein [Synechococcus sp. CS-1326]MCT0232524.1 DUF1543 domain-containing protein [Synechococcus sp. CS-1327]PZV01105.1 MAG: DUF1543 domain-containing protein [Cyanobium sp.]
MRLFLVVLGGRTAGCNIELHDVRFVVGEAIEATFPALREQWFGRRRGLHLDSYVAVERADGHRVSLRREPFAGSERLWFVNMGAYDPRQMAELHAFGLIVAGSPRAARARAKRQWLLGADQAHTDDLRAVDDCLALESVAGWHLHLSADSSAAAEPLVPDWYGYRLIDRA